MKAKIIKTGEIVDVYHEPQHSQITNIYKEAVFVNGRMWGEDELDFSINSESKEVDLEKEIQKSFIYHESHGDDFRSDCQIETAFRTGFEDGFKCKNYISKIQVNNLKEEIKRYFNEQPIMTRSEGVDYKLIPSAEKIAEHFFELGLKAQKGE